MADTYVWVVTEDDPEGPGILGLFVYHNKRDADDFVANVAAEHGQK